MNSFSYWTALSEAAFEEEVERNFYYAFASNMDAIIFDAAGDYTSSSMEWRAYQYIKKRDPDMQVGVEPWPIYDKPWASDENVITVETTTHFDLSGINTFATLPDKIKGQKFMWIVGAEVASATLALNAAAYWYAHGFNIIIGPDYYNASPAVTRASIISTADALY
jgi:hypothetical protein